MVEAFLNKLASAWRGPAITVRMEGTEKIMGTGSPRTTLHIKTPSVIKDIIKNPSLGFGEAYMRGDIDIEGDILDMLEGYYRTSKVLENIGSLKVVKRLTSTVGKRIPQSAAIANAQHHYDIGNEFYKLWLDPTMAYTCAYFAHEDDDLETAQRQKFELVCRKARLQEGQSIIDLGCGWGGLIFHAVEHYNVRATGVVAAKEQAAYIEAEAERRGVSDKVTVQCADWRDAVGSYDRVLSVGMLEHVGLRQYPEFFGLVNSLLQQDGIALVHSIGRMRPSRVIDTWMDKYIFPGYFVPAPEEMLHFATDAGLHVTDLENIWQHYAKTLDHWSSNYAANREKIIDMYDEQFDRMWWLYLRGSRGAFTWGELNLWQLVMLKGKHVSWPLNREVHVGEDTGN